MKPVKFITKIVPSVWKDRGVNWKVFAERFAPFEREIYLGGFKLKREAQEAARDWERSQKRIMTERGRSIQREFELND